MHTEIQTCCLFLPLCSELLQGLSPEFRDQLVNPAFSLQAQVCLHCVSSVKLTCLHVSLTLHIIFTCEQDPDILLHLNSYSEGEIMAENGWLRLICNYNPPFCSWVSGCQTCCWTSCKVLHTLLQTQIFNLIFIGFLSAKCHKTKTWLMLHISGSLCAKQLSNFTWGGKQIYIKT